MPLSVFPVQVWIHLSVRGWRNWSLQVHVASTTLPCSPFYRNTLCSTAWTTPSPAWYVNTNAASDTLLGFILMSVFVVKSSLILHYTSDICSQSNRRCCWCHLSFWRWCSVRSVLCSVLTLTSQFLFQRNVKCKMHHIPGKSGNWFSWTQDIFQNKINKKNEIQFYSNFIWGKKAIYKKNYSIQFIAKWLMCVSDNYIFSGLALKCFLAYTSH